MFEPEKYFSNSAPNHEYSLPACSVLFFALLATGCANPGPPRPPSLHLPSPVAHLNAQRVGSHVLLSWITPADTTEGDTLRGPISAVICRQDLLLPLVAQHPAPCNPVRRIPVTVGSTQIEIGLPPALLDEPASLLGFQVEILNVQNRSAGTSSTVYAPAGRAPSPAGTILVTPLRNAAQINWHPESAEAPIQLRRSLVPATTVLSATPTGKSLPKRAKDDITPPQATLTLPASQADPGGMIDRKIRDGDTLIYTAQRVRSVTFPFAAPQTEAANGKAAKQHDPAQTNLTVELRGEPSPPVTFTFHDTFPPASPEGLAAISGGGFGTATSNDLSWESGSELDLLGYNLYRGEIGGAFLRLNSQPIPGTAFRDLTARPGTDYAYRVTAIDQRHNESAPSVQILTNH